MSAPDFAHTPVAEENRVRKAQTLARWAYDRALDGPTIEAAPDATRRAWVRSAGLTSASEDTWKAAVGALAAYEAWAAEHPDDPRAQRTAVEPVKATVEPSDAGAVEPVKVAVPEHVAPAVPIRGTDGVPADGWPRGWDLVAQLAPLARSDAKCSRCGAAAVTAVPVVDGRPEWRCPNHPPLAGEWGHRLDWTPRPDDSAFHPDHDHRCYQPRCPRYSPGKAGTPMSASALLDERAAAKGKNRAPVHVRQAAREAEERRKGAAKAARGR